MLHLLINTGRLPTASQYYQLLLGGSLSWLIIILLSGLFLYPALSIAQSPVSDFNPATLTELHNGFYFTGKNFLADNALPLRALFFNKWGGPFSPDSINRSDNYWKTDIARINNGWRMAGFYRGELFIEANKDTVEILHMTHLKQQLPVGSVFDINLNGRGFSAYGLELSKGISLNSTIEGLTAGFTVRYLRGEKIQDGSIKGKLTSTGPMSYDFNLSLDYMYDDNLIYSRRDTISGSGNGYSLDAGIKYMLNKSLSSEVLLRDIGGRIYWKDVPYTTANATSDIKSSDNEGYQKYRPTIQGYESYKDFIQKIPLKTDIVFSYKQGAFTLTPTVNLIEDRPLYWIEIGHETTKYVSTMVGYNLNYHAVSIGGTYKEFLINIFSSDIDLRRINAIGLTLSYGY